ncbi:MAG TPA: hypothetical protein VM307_01120 [Egibacteraceae bacterium]|nr:hypothetical protein [Egibacteraceae bacterium]
MTRKLAATVITTLLILGLFPATAFASATGTASLSSASRNVFPGDRTFSLSVANTGTPLVGSRVNYVEVILPVDRAGISLPDGSVPAPTGWTATTDSVGSFQSVTWTSSSGIPAGGSQSFSLPAKVARPSSTDRSGPFEVYLSSDSGRTTNRVGAPANDATGLIANVRILETLNNLRPTDPAGVTDKTATAGQTFTYSHAVRNHALNAVTVTSTLSSAQDGTYLQTVSVPGNPGGETPVNHRVTLAGASADRQSLFTATTSATGATGNSVTDTLTVQAPPVVALSQLAPTRVRSGAGANYTFEVVGAKTGTPALNVTGGELKFATTTTKLREGVSYTGGGGSANSKKLFFEEVQVAGNNGDHQPTITLTGMDNNDHPFSSTVSDLTKIIIDNLAPVLSIAVSIPENQTAVKNGDTINISGKITGAADDLRQNSLRVVIVPNVGPEQQVTTSLTRNNDGTYDYSGSAKPSFAAEATSFVVKAEAADTAGNIGGITSGSNVIDNIIPSLLNPGRTETEQTIRVTFVDNLTSAIAGGCDPNAYSIDGLPGRVSKVTFVGESDSCRGKGSDGTGNRVLHLSSAQDRDATPSVTYRSTLNQDPAVDGARNNAVTQTIETVSGIRPLAPFISDATRNNNSEKAYSEDVNGVKTYFTRFRGTGTPATEDFRLTINNARNGYTLQVLDGSNRVLHQEQLSNPALIGTSREFTAAIRVPIGTTDGTYVRKLRFIGGGLEGDMSTFNIVLDQVAPLISTTSKNGNDVTVRFNERIVAGTDYANDWLAAENTSTGLQYYRALSVTQVDQQTRTVKYDFQNEGPFAGAFYRLRSADGKRYEDRAGNTLADTLS